MFAWPTMGRRHRLAHTFDPDLVLLDIGLPAMDGYEVAADCVPATTVAVGLCSCGERYGQDADRSRVARPASLTTA